MEDRDDAKDPTVYSKAPDNEDLSGPMLVVLRLKNTNLHPDLSHKTFYDDGNVLYCSYYYMWLLST